MAARKTFLDNAKENGARLKRVLLEEVDEATVPVDDPDYLLGYFAIDIALSIASSLQRIADCYDEQRGKTK